MEREIQEEVVIDLAELIALYLRKGFWIIGISLLFAGVFVKFRAMPEEETSKKDRNVQEATLQDKDLTEEKVQTALGTRQLGEFLSFYFRSGQGIRKTD